MTKKPRDILIYFACKYEGNYEAIIKAIRGREPFDEEAYQRYQENLNNVATITIVDVDYPPVFKTISHPPIVLFVKGDVSLIHHLHKSIAVIGTRDHSAYGKAKTIEIVKDLVANDFLIVSGMARGIDGFAHETTLEHRGKTIAVLGSGIDYPYPLSNKKLYDDILKTGLIISEYPNTTKPEPEYFKFRNRLVAALSRGVLIVEAKYRSGTVITVGYALERGCDIYCVPERAGVDSGCNKLIKDGAYLVESAADIIRLWPN